MEIKLIVDAITLAGIAGLAARELMKSRNSTKNNGYLVDIKGNVEEINAEVKVIKTRIYDLEETDKEIGRKLTKLDDRIYELVRNKSKGG